MCNQIFNKLLNKFYPELGTWVENLIYLLLCINTETMEMFNF